MDIKLMTILLITSVSRAAQYHYDMMKCHYGERGSLTATCVNATPGYFKGTLYRFDHLDETLRCLSCNLSTLYTATFDISGNQIKYLDLKNSKIETIRSGAFLGLIFMEELDLSHNSIKGLNQDIFNGVKKLRKIDLSVNEINFISPNVFLELTNLEELYLNDNKLTSLTSNTFNGVKKLKQLDLSNNQIKTFEDDVFSSNVTIKILNLANNNIENLKGSEFFNATDLLEINLSRNKLKSIVINLIPTNHLRTLYLSDNEIDKLHPGDLDGLHALEVLDLGRNQIQQIEQKTFKQLYNLHNLNLTGNNLTEFRTGIFSGLPQLQDLNCSENNIQTVSVSGVFPISNLHSLDLSRNNITDLDYTSLIARLPKLSYLKLDGNNFECNLEREMEDLFAEDNIKFVVDEARPYSSSCSPEVEHSAYRKLADYTLPLNNINGTTTAEIWLFVLMSIIIISIIVLFFAQYRVYQILHPKTPERSISSVQIISSNLDAND